mmetsp:Transcript_5536/g.8695  ORF Transcript_5536/g.8695 Transcript_5536/m.8695 type:complete len:277 (-) Transcript_5536:474-1304(-)
MLEVLERSVVLPGVEDGHVFPLHLLVGALFGSEFVGEIILLLLTQDVQSLLEVLLHDVHAGLQLLLQFSLFALFGDLQLLGKGPEAEVTEDDAEVDLEGLHEIGVAESEDRIEHVLYVDSDHPDLLVVDEPAGSVVETVLAESSTEADLELADHGFVHVENILLVLLLDLEGKTLAVDVDGGKGIVVLLEELNGLFEVSDTDLYGFHQIVVGGGDVFLALSLHAAENQIQLVQRLSVSTSGRLLQELDGLVQVLSDAESFVVKHSDPMGAHHAALL